MNTRALFPLLFTVASFSASAGNWAVKNGWCQTMTEDGQALVMLKNGTIGITGLMQGCPNGVQTLLGSRISINGNRAEMSPEAAGIAACLMTYSHHACRTECYAMTVHYYRLRDYALQHPECSAIMRIID